QRRYGAAQSRGARSASQEARVTVAQLDLRQRRDAERMGMQICANFELVQPEPGFSMVESFDLWHSLAPSAANVLSKWTWSEFARLVKRKLRSSIAFFVR